jgi:hypothetical protein
MNDKLNPALIVKDLVWLQVRSFMPRIVFEAKSSFGLYDAYHNGRWRLHGVAGGIANEASLDAAKAAAQADYTARVLAMLDLDAVQAAFIALKAYEAWEADMILNGDWANGTLRYRDKDHDTLIEVQALRNAALAKLTGVCSDV